jgi:hypothetical protein
LYARQPRLDGFGIQRLLRRHAVLLFAPQSPDDRPMSQAEIVSEKSGAPKVAR